MTRLIAFLLCAAAAFAADIYQKPPQAILDVLNAPATPLASVSPAKDYLLLAEPVRYPPIAELAQPMLRLAGLRINPNTNGPHRPLANLSLTLKKISGGAETKIALPPGARPEMPEWSPDGKRFAFTNTTAGGIELWVGTAATATARRIAGVRINAAYSDPIHWMPDSRALLVQLVPAVRGKAPAAHFVPAGPNIQESSGKEAAVWTFQDLLKSQHDEALLEYYATAQLALVDIVSGQTTPVGRPAMFETLSPSPDGKHLLVARTRRPFSYLYTHSFFPKEVEVWDRAGKIAHKLASLPLADAVPQDGVPTGPRSYSWRPTEPATLVWVEALDGGNPKNKAPFRDHVLMLKAPFSGAPAELAKLRHRFAGLLWSEKDSIALLTEYERERRWVRTFLLRANDPASPPSEIWSRDTRDRYKDPGTPLTRMAPGGRRVLEQDGDSIYLSGTGSSPKGDRPFLDRFNLRTLRAERLFRCDETSYETVAGLLAADGSRFLTRRETPADPPNYFVRAGAELRSLTKFPDPAPQLRRIQKQLVTYTRPDGVQLSFTLYLPPGYRKGTRLPTVVWAYPLEYNDPDTAGQIAGSTQRFTSITGMSHLFYLLAGYAVLDSATMPVVGDPKTANNTYIEQIVASAKAAIDKAAEMGVTDPARVGVGGHSYGAFMTANLLANSDLFRAGVARSGAYNRTLTPFGFQSERRTLWEAPEIYLRMSPFMRADKLKTPILLIHGEADNNSGTFPIQSERLYQAIRGNGGTVRLVMLPFESHGYAARESIEHTLHEMIAWFDKYVKNAPPR